MINRAVFFGSVRSPLFGGRLTDEQVRGVSTLLDAWERLAPTGKDEHLAYILAGVFHETGRRMVPVREGFARTDAAARSTVAALYKAKKISTNYALPVNGVSYYGRGRIQNTWERNYRRLQERFSRPFVKQPDLLLDDAIDAEVTIIGHLEGIWTGRKLADYDGPEFDAVNARRIVNGTDKAAAIAGYYRKFLVAILASQAAAPPKPASTTPLSTGPASSGFFVTLLKGLYDAFRPSVQGRS